MDSTSRAMTKTGRLQAKCLLLAVFIDQVSTKTLQLIHWCPKVKQQTQNSNFVNYDMNLNIIQY